MKKFLIIILALFLIPLSSCDKKAEYNSYISDLRLNVYEGESESYSLYASFGYREVPFVNDCVVGEIKPRLLIKLLGVTDTVTDYEVEYSVNEKLYLEEFSVNPLKDCLTAVIEPDIAPADTFDVVIIKGDKRETVTLNSKLSGKEMTCYEALNSLKTTMPDLTEHYLSKRQEISVEVYLKIIVAESGSYWYVGFATGENRLKALLLNAETGEVLAIKDVI